MSRSTTLTPAALVAGVLLVGCAAPPRQVPTATALETSITGEVRVGERMADFRMMLASGKAARMVDVRGRVTVLLFSAEREWPSCEQARALSDLARHESCCYIGVRVVVVGPAEAPCAEAWERVADCRMPDPRVLLVCDPQAGVRRLYGEAAPGRWYLIDNYETVRDTGTVGDLDALREAVRNLVRSIEDQDDREGYYEWWGPE